MTKIEKLLEGLRIIHIYEPSADVYAVDDVIIAGDYNHAYNEYTAVDFQKMIECDWEQGKGSWIFRTDI